MSHPLLERSGSATSSQPSFLDPSTAIPSTLIYSSLEGGREGGGREGGGREGGGGGGVAPHDIDSFFAMGGALTPRASDAGSPVKDHMVTSNDDSSPILMGSSLSFALSHRGGHKDFDELVKMGNPPKKKAFAAEDIDSLLKISEASHPASASAGTPAEEEKGEATGAAETESLNGALRASSSSIDLQQETLNRSHVAGILLSVRSGQDIDTVLAAEPAASTAAPRKSIGRFNSFPPRSYSSQRDRPESSLLDPSKTRSRSSAPNIFALFFRDEKQ